MPASCTLAVAGRPLWAAEWDALFAERLARVSRPEPSRLRLVLRGGEGVEERMRDLAGREGAVSERLRTAQVARAAGVNARTLRRYDGWVVTVLRVVEAARCLGFILGEVAELLETGRHCHGLPFPGSGNAPGASSPRSRGGSPT
ncbi:hypothetical protein [Kitasatospora phosalacinea]|uniref:hypothetical protein n=1 Tax=Kitasatospora phosalacinea TaxID=2065 RepID=UPI0006918646|nr:hypothetical protein [Kitasatospora phosalacinea]